MYFDNASTTPLLPCVKEKIISLLDTYGNPSNLHYEGVAAKRILEESRETIASCLNCEPDEIFFTSCGSESNNFALDTKTWQDKATLVSSSFEHPSVLNSTYNFGLKHTVDPNEQGIITLEAFKKKTLDAVDEQAVVHNTSKGIVSTASIMTVNNEIGTIQPIKDLCNYWHKTFPDGIFHTDAVQAVGHIPINVKDLGVDLLSFSGHKFGAPKGIGALFIKRSLVEAKSIRPFIYGGHQEKGLRAGTENVVYAAALATALKYMCDHMEEHEYRIREMQRFIMGYIFANIPGAYINGSVQEKERAASNINVMIPGVDGESLALALSAYGVCISARSACSSGSDTPSHVLKAIGLQPDEAACSIRISLGPQNTMEECERMLKILEKNVETLRKLDVKM